MAVSWNGSLLQAFKSFHIDGVTWKPVIVSLKKASDSLIKCIQNVKFGIGFEK